MKYLIPVLLLLIFVFVFLSFYYKSNKNNFSGRWRAVATTIEMDEDTKSVRTFPVEGLYTIRKASKNHYVLDVSSERRVRLISSVTPQGELMIIGNSAVNPEAKDSAYHSILSVKERRVDGTPEVLEGVSWVFLDEADKQTPTVFRTSSIKLIRHD